MTGPKQCSQGIKIIMVVFSGLEDKIFGGTKIGSFLKLGAIW